MKQVPGEEQPGSRDPSACREVFGHQEIKDNILSQVPAVCSAGSC